MKVITYFLSSFVSAFAIALLIFPLLLLENSCDNMELRSKVRILKQQAKQIEIKQNEMKIIKEENKNE